MKIGISGEFIVGAGGVLKSAKDITIEAVPRTEGERKFLDNIQNQLWLESVVTGFKDGPFSGQAQDTR